MKKLYFLNEEEKNRILTLHENATKRQYLGEEQTDRQTNINKVYCGVKNGVITAGAFKDKKWDEYVKTYKISSAEIETAKKSCPKNNNSQQYKQQVVTKTSDTTKQIQKLLGLPETGNMDTGLLQKINDKLNGGEKASTSATSTPASASTQTSASTQAYNFNVDPNIGKGGINFNQMTPEQIAQGVKSATPPQESIAATTPPTNKEKRQERRDLRAANRAEMQALRDKQRGNQ